MITLYLSLIFAYLAAAHFAGKKLSRLQTIILSGIFTVATTFILYQLIGIFISLEFWGMQIVDGYRILARDFSQPELAELADYISTNSRLGWEEGVIVGLGVLGALSSLFFMWSIRHPKVK